MIMRLIRTFSCAYLELKCLSQRDAAGDVLEDPGPGEDVQISWRASGNCVRAGRQLFQEITEKTFILIGL